MVHDFLECENAPESWTWVVPITWSYISSILIFRESAIQVAARTKRSTCSFSHSFHLPHCTMCGTHHKPQGLRTRARKRRLTPAASSTVTTCSVLGRPQLSSCAAHSMDLFSSYCRIFTAQFILSDRFILSFFTNLFIYFFLLNSHCQLNNVAIWSVTAFIY